MLKPAVAAAVLAVAGSTFVYAQQRSGEPDFDRGSRFAERGHMRPSIGDVRAFADARIAALKAGLQLTPDQEKNWTPFEQALRDLVKLRIERIQARESGEQAPPANFFDRLQRRADAMSQFGGALKHVAEAGGPLYQSLDDAQKHRFKVLASMLRPHHHVAGGGWWHRGGPGGEDRGGGGYFERRGGGPDEMMTPDSDDHGPQHMMGRNDGGPHEMMGGDEDDDSEL